VPSRSSRSEPRTPGALRYLKKYFKLVILSKVDNETFQASNRRLQVEFDAIYTAEGIGSYKPSSRNFDYMIEKLEGIGVRKEKILHTAESMFHDHKPANDHCLNPCRIYRRHAQQGLVRPRIRAKCRMSTSGSTACMNW
jgi:2-haloacid dehalogenase